MKHFISLLFITILVFQLNAQNELKTTQINLFKNGDYFVVKEGSVNTEEGSWNLPLKNFSPLLSTFWASSTDVNRLSRIEIKEDKIKKSYPIQSMDEVLTYNKGKKIKLTYLPFERSDKTSLVEGTLEYYSALNKTAKIKSNTGEFKYVNTQNIIELAFTDAPLESFELDSTATVAKFVFEKNIKSTPVKLSYMQRGISWSPGYNIRLMDDNKLFLQMNAVIVNESEDIVDAEVSMTLGGGTYKYGEQLDPIMVQAIAAMAFENFSGGFANQIYSNTITSGISESARRNVSQEVSQEYNTIGEKSEDVFRYKLGRLTIPKNSRISKQIFGLDIPYEDVYDIDINDGNQFYTSRTCNNEGKTIDVFHSLKLHNNSDYPLTTGPVFVQDKKLQPMAQDQIKYTPVGGSVKVQLAKAVDISAINSEKEIDNMSVKKSINGRTYQQAIISGEVFVENLQKKSVKVNIAKNINGNIIKVSDNGSIKKTGRHNEVNPNSISEWIIDLKPNEKKTITYTYEVYYR